LYSILQPQNISVASVQHNLSYLNVYKQTNVEYLVQDEFEDTKRVIRIRIWKKNRQHNDQRKSTKQKDKQRATKHTHKTKDRVTRTPLKTGA
jgi:hypothetical protein